MLYNRQSFPTDETIRWAHGYIGMTHGIGRLQRPAHRHRSGALHRDRDRDRRPACGNHSSEFLGFSPTERDVELPFVAFYRFDTQGKLSSERVVMNLGPLHA